MKFYFTIFLFLPLILFGQNDIQQIVNSEFEKGHFNGTVFYADGKQSVKINKGFSNIQFDVAIDSNTRFPIASVTKLFTSLAILHLQEKGLIDLKDKIGKYIPNLPENCNDITIRDLMTHHSGLENEPIKAVMNKYSIDDYIRNFVKKSSNDTLKFNYNNVDFVLLSKVIENITKKTFSQSIEDMIIQPLKLENTGFVSENDIIKNLAYGYHNYSFGEGEKDEPLFNDRRYISNYYGAGGMYSTTEDLYKFLLALKDNKLISEKSKNEFLLKPQADNFVDWLSGKPTFGFYFDDKKNVY
jgi:CubicO group peptidase (beta-lactamase class C family)